MEVIPYTADNLGYLVSTYHKDPIGFLHDVLMIDEFDSWQLELLNHLVAGKTRIAIASCNGSGKSFITTAIELWWLLCKPSATVSCCSASYVQVQEHLRLVRQKALSSLVKDYYDLSNSMQIKLPDSGDAAYIRAVPNNKQRPESIAGLHHGSILTIFDEASGIHPEIFMAQEGNMTTDGATWIVIGNPLASGTAFHELFKGDSRWTTMHIDARNAKFTSKEWVKGMIDAYGIDDDRVRARVCGLFPNGSVNTVVGEGDYLDAEKRYISILGDRGEVIKPDDAVVIGLDVATHKGADSTVICAIAGNTLLDIREIVHSDNVDLADKAQAYFKKWDARVICIDYTGGYGAGPGDILKRVLPSGSVREVVFSSSSSDKDRWLNKRAELWMKYGEWLKTALIPKNANLKRDSLGIEWWVTTRGCVQVESKDDIKARIGGSTDWGDSVICALSTEVATKVTQTISTHAFIARQRARLNGATFV